MDKEDKMKLIEFFSRDLDENEMEEFLKLKFISRSGGGIGLHRLIRSMKLEKLL